MEAHEGEQTLEVEGLFDNLKASLLDSTYSQPVATTLTVVDEDLILEVVVVAMRSRFVSFSPQGESHDNMGCWNRPDWEFEALLIRPPFDPVQRQTRLLITVEVDNGGSPQNAFVRPLIADE